MSKRRCASAAEAIDAWDLAPKSDVLLRSQIESSPSSYRMDAAAEVLLRANPDLVPLLVEACQRLRALFGPEAAFVLERFEDPESPGEAPRLFLAVHTNMGPDEADETLQRFYRDYWLAASAGAVGRIDVTVELV